MKFPLPNGHYFGLNPYDVRVHDGNDNWADEANLKHFQRRYALVWNRDWPVTGRFDGPSQRACVLIQREHQLPVTGVLDEDTWKACFSGPKSTESPEHDVPVGTPTPERTEAPEANSEASAPRDAVPGGLGTAGVAAPTVPEWFKPGKPVGMGSSGDVVRKIRSLLGIQVRDKWSQDVTSKVRGFQKANDLPATGWVDTRTAALLDERLGSR